MTGESNNQTNTRNAQEEELPQVGLCGLCICCIGCVALIPLLCCCAVTNLAVNKAQGKRWDSVQNKWVIDNLDEEGKSLNNIPDDDSDILKLNVSASDAPQANDAPTAVCETKYYDDLGVPTDAEPSKIKKAYYIKARAYHPDRVGADNKEAADKFKDISEAYQVLSDEKLRKQYDKNGEAGLSGDRTQVSADSIDPSLVFTFLFGSDQFNDIVGRLRLVTQTLAEDTKLTVQQQIEIERRRVIRLAMKLAQTIQSYVNGEQESSRQTWKRNARTLVDLRYGEEILHVVGSTYHLVATQCIGTWKEGTDARKAENDMKRDAAIAAYKGAQAMQGEGGAGEDGDKLPEYITTLWNVTVIDITSTLREVVMKVLNDNSVSADIRNARAEAVKELGTIFQEQKSTDPNRDRSVRNLYMSATKAAMEKALNEAQQDRDEEP